MKPGIRLRRALWSAIIFLAFIGVAVALRRMVHLLPVVVRGYHPPAATSNPVAARFAALDDLFARYPILTLVHIAPGLLFMMLGPLQFSSTIRARHLRWHRWSGRIFVICGAIIGISALAQTSPSLARRRSGPATAAECEVRHPNGCRLLRRGRSGSRFFDHGLELRATRARGARHLA